MNEVYLLGFVAIFRGFEVRKVQVDASYLRKATSIADIFFLFLYPASGVAE